MTEALLEAKSISKKYEDRYVLQNTDLKIDHQQFVAILVTAAQESQLCLISYRLY